MRSTAAASYGYDSMGRITSATEFKGQKTVYTYDDIGRLEYVDVCNAEPIPTPVLGLKYTYDAKGNVSIVEATTCSSGCGEEFNYTYDSDRNLLESRDGVDDLGSVEYEYDGAGRLDILEYPIEWNTSPTPTVTDTFQREYAYDLANRVTEVRDGETSAPFAEYDYNEASQRTRVDYGNDSYSLYEYDDYGRLSLLANMAPNDATMTSFNYSYDRDGLVESVTRENGDYLIYEYDDLNRLTEESKYDDEDSIIWQRLYEFDKVGNRTKRVRKDLDSGNLVTITENLYYNGLGQLATMEWTEDSTDMRNLYTYDLNGNLATKQEQSWSGGSYSADTSWTYTWDVQDRLTKVEIETGDFGGTDEKTIEYQYCPACGGAMTDRIEKDENGAITSWVRYEYEGLNLIRMDQMYDGSDTGSNLNAGDPFRPLCIYSHGPGSISNVVQNKAYSHTDGDAVPDATTELWYFYDRMGNMLNMHYGAGYLTWDMDAYGNQTDSGNWPGMDSNGPKERLTGKMIDDETGLYFFMARWYDPEVGRFVSRDPALEISKNLPDPAGPGPRSCACSGNLPIGKPRIPWRPIHLNGYLFCGARPTDAYDPNGAGIMDCLTSYAEDTYAAMTWWSDFIDSWCPLLFLRCEIAFEAMRDDLVDLLCPDGDDGPCADAVDVLVKKLGTVVSRALKYAACGTLKMEGFGAIAIWMLPCGERKVY